MKTAKSFFEQSGGTYTRVGDYLLPNLAIDDQESRPLGKYGRMRKRYLKEHHSALYTNLLLSGKLWEHLTEIDQSCEERMDIMIQQMKEREGVTEMLKAANQLEWVRRMNGIRSRAEEIVLNELIYPEENLA